MHNVFRYLEILNIYFNVYELYGFGNNHLDKDNILFFKKAL